MLNKLGLSNMGAVGAVGGISSLGGYIASLGASSYYPCNEASGATLTDTIGGNNGTIVDNGNVLFAQTGQVGNCLYLNGTSTYFTIPNSAPFPLQNNTAFTVSILLKWDATSGNRGMFYSYNTGGNAWYRLNGGHAGGGYWTTAFFVRNDSSTTLENSTTSNGPLDATWTLWTWRDNNGTVDFFANNTKSSTNHNYTRGTVTTNTNWIMANSLGIFKGWVQHISIYTKSLSDAEIAGLVTWAGL